LVIQFHICHKGIGRPAAVLDAALRVPSGCSQASHTAGNRAALLRTQPWEANARSIAEGGQGAWHPWRLASDSGGAVATLRTVTIAAVLLQPARGHTNPPPSDAPVAELKYHAASPSHPCLQAAGSVARCTRAMWPRCRLAALLALVALVVPLAVLAVAADDDAVDAGTGEGSPGKRAGLWVWPVTTRPKCACVWVQRGGGMGQVSVGSLQATSAHS